MSEESMIERVAKAIYVLDHNRRNAARIGAMEESPAKASDPLPPWAGDYRALARAAIEAMREPTAVMQEAGQAAGGKAYEWTGDSPVFHSRNSWPAMIDAALT